MNNIVIERENVIKFLVVLVDENLSWKQDINNLAQKYQKALVSFTNQGIVKQSLLKQLYSFTAI